MMSGDPVSDDSGKLTDLKIYPPVLPGSNADRVFIKSRLRISVSAAHSEEELEFAVGVIARVLREEGICRA